MYYILEHTERESEAKLRALSSGGLGAAPPTSLEPERSRLSSEARQPSAKQDSRQRSDGFTACINLTESIPGLVRRYKSVLYRNERKMIQYIKDDGKQSNMG